MLLALVEVEHCAATSSMIARITSGPMRFCWGGDDMQHRRWLPRAATGEVGLWFALTEPGGGSNPADLTTRAVRDGDGYRLDGQSSSSRMPGAADRLVVFARRIPRPARAGSRRSSWMPRRPACRSVRRRSSWASARHRRIRCALMACACRWPIDWARKALGFRMAMRVLDNSRLDVVATSLGIAEAALALTVSWLQERHVGGEPLARKQGVQWMVADMKVRLEAAWALAMQAVARCAARRSRWSRRSPSCTPSRWSRSWSIPRQQLHGGYGYSRALPLQRMARDARILRIYEGASEVQRTIIARSVLGTRERVFHPLQADSFPSSDIPPLGERS
jgi:alkylation response protein AidB-like acyl-CoA dehydrogenase